LKILEYYETFRDNYCKNIGANLSPISAMLNFLIFLEIQDFNFTLFIYDL
jgi:hypothetical protein